MKKSKNYYLRIIRENFPNAKFRQSKIIRKGWDNDVIILDDKLVFRFPKNKKILKRFHIELKVLEYLKTKNLQVSTPDYIHLPDDRAFGGYRFLEGELITVSNFKRLSVKQKRSIARQLGEFMTAVHLIPLSRASELGIVEARVGFWKGHKYLKKELAIARKLVFPKLAKKEQSWIEKQYSDFFALKPASRYTVVHGDLFFWNLLYDTERSTKVSVLDFGDAELGDPAIDFGFVWAYGKEFAKEVKKYYAVKMDADFLERSRFPAKLYIVSDMIQALKGQSPMTFRQVLKNSRKVIKHYSK